MLIKRPFWQQLIEKAWQQKNIIWLMGLRRVGKTSLCQSLSNTEYFDCERPRVRQMLDDIEGFLTLKTGKRLILDEIHKLDDPAEFLKIGADHYPEVKIIATGSSTLGASSKFKDTLTGRKKEIWLTPLLLQEMESFGSRDIKHRFLFGGMPAYFASKDLPEEYFREWIDAYWAKDIQDLFSISKRYSFQKFTELLLAQSGGQFEANKFAVPCEVSRQTISNYLAVLEATFIVHIIRPYSTHKATEIVSAPKVYGFDTGFICYAKSWRELRAEDLGLLWEHCVLNEIHGHLQTRKIHYWRDKQGHEIDFVLCNRNNSSSLDVIECKFSSPSLSDISVNIKAFRNHYPEGKNFVVANNVDMPFQRRCGDLVLHVENPASMVKSILHKKG